MLSVVILTVIVLRVEAPFAIIRLTRKARQGQAGNTKGGSITVQSVSQIKTKIVSCHTANSKTVKQDVNGAVILPSLVFPGQTL